MLGAGEYGLALEMLADWLCDEETPVPTGARAEALSLATKKGVEERKHPGSPRIASVRDGDDQLAAHVTLAAARERSGQLLQRQDIGHRDAQLPGVGQPAELGQTLG